MYKKAASILPKTMENLPADFREVSEIFFAPPWNRYIFLFFHQNTSSSETTKAPGDLQGLSSIGESLPHGATKQKEFFSAFRSDHPFRESLECVSSPSSSTLNRSVMFRRSSDVPLTS